MRPQDDALWRNGDFLKLWAGQTVSIFGSMLSRLALSFTAILTLDVSPFEMGLLRAAETVPTLLVGLAAGVWIDRLRRRPILIGADLGRALLLGSIPVAAVLGVLRVEQLYLVVFLVGILTVGFDVAYQSYLPSIVRRDQLVKGNSKLEASASVAEFAGFGLAGPLVQALTAPIAILVDSVSFLVSAVSLALIRKPEPRPVPPERRESFRQEVGDGLRLAFGQPILRALALAVGMENLSMGVVGAVFMLFVTRELLVEPTLQGIVYAIGGISSLVGALAAGRLAFRWGVGPTLVAGLFLSGLGALFVPLAGGPLLAILALLVAQQLVTDSAATVYNVNAVSLRQAVTPDRFLGRVNASLRFIGWNASLAGALAGGVLGDRVGLRPTLIVGALGIMLAALGLLLSPVRALPEAPGVIRDS